MKFDFLVCRSVDLSQGQLLDLNIGVLSSIELVKYSLEQSPKLRCVIGTICDKVDAKSLILAIQKLRHLEELHIIVKPIFKPNDLETIGIACTMLKSFSYHNCVDFEADFKGFGEAIGKSMPNLLHLDLCVHGIGYKELEAILDDRPHLKSLDLRRC
ncbi:putative F-box/LRR-repeat protein 9 [Salvia hispanica]|uniref:putative F-box/LRR-repeat protein 9 n=1 Tax=Salvia hispanica TaxID=49212 RepID=UPI002009C365|nr:putative F-box/LRR-repeat protein 9 [Salvia hispanica]